MVILHIKNCSWTTGELLEKQNMAGGSVQIAPKLLEVLYLHSTGLMFCIDFFSNHCAQAVMDEIEVT